MPINTFANQAGVITVANAAEDYHSIVGNTLNGGTVSDSGTGTHKIIFNPGAQMTSTTVAGQTCTLGSTCGLSSSSAALGTDQNMSSANTYVDGPQASNGTSETYLVTGHATFGDTSGNVTITCKIYDGTNAAVDQNQIGVANASTLYTMSLTGLVTNPAGNIRIACADTGTHGVIQATFSSVTAVRIN